MPKKSQAMAEEPTRDVDDTGDGRGRRSKRQKLEIVARYMSQKVTTEQGAPTLSEVKDCVSEWGEMILSAEVTCDWVAKRMRRISNLPPSGGEDTRRRFQDKMAAAKTSLGNWYSPLRRLNSLNGLLERECNLLLSKLIVEESYDEHGIDREYLQQEGLHEHDILQHELADDRDRRNHVFVGRSVHDTWLKLRRLMRSPLMQQINNVFDQHVTILDHHLSVFADAMATVEVPDIDDYDDISGN